MPHKRAAWIYRTWGVLLTLAGLGLAMLVPLELQCYAWFAPGGRFYYPGYGYGSLMFANITLQIIAYALLAALLLPLGYGHLRLRPWSARWMRGAMLAWLALGLPVAVAALAVLYAQKELSLAAGLACLALAILTYPALPLLLLRLYRTTSIRGLLADSSTQVNDIATALGLILAVTAILWMVPALFRGLWPALTGWLTGTPALVLDVLCGLGTLAMAIVWLVGRWRPWSLTLALLASLGPLWTVTLATTPWTRLLALLDLPALEHKALSGVPLHGAYLAALVLLPLILTVGLILRGSRPRLTQG